MYLVTEVEEFLVGYGSADSHGSPSLFHTAPRHCVITGITSGLQEPT